MFAVTSTHSVRKAILLHGIIFGLLICRPASTGTSGAASTGTTGAAPTGTSNSAPPTKTSIAPTGTSNSAPPTKTSIAPTGTSNSAPPTKTSIAPTGTSNSAPPTKTSIAPTGTSNSAPPTKTSIAPPTKTSIAPPTKTSIAPIATTSSVCSTNPCGDIATCVNLHSGFACECNFGFYYENNTKNCKKGKTFCGELTIQMDFHEDLKNKISLEYMKLRNNITIFFESAFNNRKDYRTTLIVDVRKGSVITSVTNTFTADAEVNEAIVKEAVDNILNDNPLYSFQTVSTCDTLKCDNKTTTNCFQPPNGAAAECICKAGFYKPSPSDNICINSCYLKCKELNEHCVPQGESVACECQAGYKRNNGKCESCPFGYNGIDCKDGFKLGIIIFGVIAGVLILSLILGLIYIRRKHVKHDELKEPLVNGMDKSLHPVTIPRVKMVPTDNNQRMDGRQGLYNEIESFEQSNSNESQNQWHEMGNFNKGLHHRDKEYDSTRHF
ncbi:mucin-13-like isoform X6 [Heterodontus francisci]|uniref:mucin-13-like isoform X6 n=1 Tax=Heterodontus francisci TaxID=7792 RepID=UPI00355B1C28